MWKWSWEKPVTAQCWKAAAGMRSAECSLVHNRFAKEKAIVQSSWGHLPVAPDRDYSDLLRRNSTWSPPDDDSRITMGRRRIHLCNSREICLRTTKHTPTNVLIFQYLHRIRKRCHYIFVSNFAKGWPILNTLSPKDVAYNKFLTKRVNRWHAAPFHILPWWGEKFNQFWNFCFVSLRGGAFVHTPLVNQLFLWYCLGLWVWGPWRL